ncbi:MAG TPA: hypothetical protein VJ992_08985 [Gemmatimonadales bacterium]|nr:hypothetical protein [Gemmatimonadales bacterium]
MLHANRRAAAALFLIAPLWAGSLAAQAPQVVGYSASSGRSGARIELQLADKPSLRIALRGGDLTVNGEVVGHYVAGGSLDQAWRAMAARTDLTTDQFVATLKQWKPDGVAPADRAAFETIEAKLAGVATPKVAAVPAPPSAPAAAVAPAVPAAPVVAGVESARVGIDAARAAAEQVREAMQRPEVQRALRDAARVRGDQAAQFASPIGSVWGGLLGLLGTIVALGGIGFGVSFFAERQLDVVADTVSTSLARSFFVGLFAQPLLIPALGAVIVGLTLTVVGIVLVVPAAVAFAFAVVAAFIGGYLAVARVAGLGFMQKRQKRSETGGFGTLLSLAYGVAILLAIWLPAIVLGPVPVAGTILQWTAITLTWAFATTGFGAMILTRGGLRGTFGRRYAPRLIDSSWPETEPAFSTGEWLAGKTDQ